ncbi:MAG: hypothetical protein IJH34_08235 [Romboutsia sp.]|nr:hypothetical protein [Romboutsia sp.]
MTVKLQHVGMYAEWCTDIMDKIEEIAKEKYPNIKIWIDTGSRYNVAMAILEQIRRDLKIRK